ncbi:unnamed protein product [Cladocopium goreaui]|nr:unnamed protein product [Cladocopium goreaui]
METHKQLAATSNIAYPMDVPGFLNDSPWFQLLQQREKEAICFAEAFNKDRPDEQLIEFVDISQTVTRMAHSTRDSKVIPTVLPSAKLWCMSQHRWVLGSEMLRFQGLHVEEFDTAVEESESLLSDLAGNAFSAPCISAAILAVLGSVRYASDSEDEEMLTINSAFKAVGLLNRMAD